MGKSSLALSLVQVSPLVIENDEPTNNSQSNNLSLSSPLVKLWLYSMNLKVIWDDGSEDEADCCNRDQEKSSHDFQTQQTTNHNDYMRFANDYMKEYRQLKVLKGAAFICNDSNDGTLDLVQRGRTAFTEKGKAILPMVSVASQDPSSIDGISCLLRVYSIPISRLSSSTGKRVHIVDGTLIQILPPICVTYINNKLNLTCAKTQSIPANAISTSPKFVRKLSLQNDVLGIMDVTRCHEDLIDDENILSCYEPETIKALAMRMKALMSRPILIGTTSDSIQNLERECKRNDRLKKSIDSFWRDHGLSNVATPKSFHHQNNSQSKITEKFLPDGALTVHDPNHGYGKTALVKAIARSVLKCDAVHVINGGSFFPKYGASGADAAFESLLHQIIISTAVTSFMDNGDQKSEISSVCIILDHLESFVSILSGSDIGDPSLPALHANAAYLSKMVHSMAVKRYFPSPTKNKLYNIKGSSGFISQ